MTNEDKILEMLTEINQGMGDMKEKLMSIDTRLESVETRLESVETRLESVETRLESVEDKINDHSGALKTLIEWAEDAQVVVKIPFAK